MDCIGSMDSHVWLFIIVIIATGSYYGESVQDEAENRGPTKRRMARVDGDIILGAIFPVHRQPSLKTAYTRQCGDIWEQYGMHRIEAFLQTLDKINRSPTLLPNITLGCDIRDSCWYAPVALEQSIDFIKNSIASLEQYRSANGTIIGDQCSKAHAKPIAGLIGPGSSTVTIQIQNVLSLFNIPQIGYSATSKDLSDKSFYEYFLRVVPSDLLQARALVDLVVHFNWTYISTVYTEGNYGQMGMEEFRKMARQSGICEATSDKVPNNADNDAYDAIINNLNETSNARVVVCFCEGMTVRGLIKASQRLNVAGQFLFIGSDGWAVRPDVVEGVEEVAAGSITMKLYSPTVKDFDSHYLALKPDTNQRNPWFKEFWQEKFKCFLPGPERDKRYKKQCTGDEGLEQDYVQDAKLGFVLNAIYTMAHALHNMHRDVCDGAIGICPKMRVVNGTAFLRYLLNVSFIGYSNDELHFDRRGDPPGRYDIMNYRPTPDGRGFEYYKIGGWVDGNLTVDSDTVFWPEELRTNGSAVFESVCSKPCAVGHIKIQKGNSDCCWVCSACQPHHITKDGVTCEKCRNGYYPDPLFRECLASEVERIQWGDNEAIVAIVLACVGVVTTLVVLAIFLLHHNTAVVKASTRELSYIILIGITTSYITTFPLIAKPSVITCHLVRIMPGLSFSLIYGALVTKTNRIARILAGSKKKIMTRKPRFMSACAQVVITFIIIGIEATVITVMLVFEPGQVAFDHPSRTRVRMVCKITPMAIIVPLGFDMFLIVLCTAYAIKTRNLPENFNEAKFIGFTMYTTCVIWLAFVPIYFGSDNKVITMCISVSLSATVALILLFFPKLYIIVLKPEKNNRSQFTTSKEVRCHIGPTRVDEHYSGTYLTRQHGRMVFPWGKASPEDQSIHPSSTLSPPLHSPKRKSITRGWRERGFEGAALALFRQKAAINKWKRKTSSVIQKPPGTERLALGGNGTRPTGGWSKMLSSASTSGNDSHHRTPFKEDIPMTTNAKVQSSVIKMDTSCFANAPPLKTAKTTQTDDELLQSFFVDGLRRRVHPSNSVGSDTSRVFMSTDTIDNPLLSSTSNNLLMTDTNLIPIDGVSHVDEVGGEDEDSPLLPINVDSNPYNHSDKIESTSEESLSDQELNDLDDIEDLLCGVKLHEGSFGSLPREGKLHNIQPGKLKPFQKILKNSSFEYSGPGMFHASSDQNLRPALSVPALINSQWETAGKSGYPTSLLSFPQISVRSNTQTNFPSCPKSATDASKELGLVSTPSSGTQTSNDVNSKVTEVELHREDSIGMFQELLHSKGLSLDMTSVQSSDV